MTETDRHQVVCDTSGRVGRYPSLDAAIQMSDAHRSVHEEDEPDGEHPSIVVVS